MTELEQQKKRKKTDRRRNAVAGGSIGEGEHQANVVIKVKGMPVDRASDAVKTHSGRVSVAPIKLAASEYSELPRVNRGAGRATNDQRRLAANAQPSAQAPVKDKAQPSAQASVRDKAPVKDKAQPSGQAPVRNKAQASAQAPVKDGSEGAASDSVLRVLPGDRVWALDVHQNWAEARVLKTHDRRVKVHLLGWDEVYDEWKDVRLRSSQRPHTPHLRALEWRRAHPRLVALLPVRSLTTTLPGSLGAASAVALGGGAAAIHR